MRAGEFRGLGGDLGKGMDLREREVAEHPLKVLPECTQQRLDHGFGRRAVGTLVVSVFDEHDGCVGIAAPVITRRQRRLEHGHG